MNRKIIGNTVGTTMKPQTVVENSGVDFSDYATEEYVEDLTSYKTLVDVTLDDTNSGTNKIMAELPLEDFLRCNDFTIYVEMPVDSTMTESVSFSGYLTNITQSAYMQCVLYNWGTITNTTGFTHRIFSLVRKLVDGSWLSITSNPTTYQGANSSNNAKSMIEGHMRWGYENYPPYLRISISKYTFPSGTRVIVEGR